MNTGDFTAAVNQAVTAIQQISIAAVLLLVVLGAALLMWGGISDGWRVKAVRIIGCCIAGAALLFLFATPMAAFLTSTFSGGGGGGA
jgi:protein-S-isoprenylcysteine O-methyltransferase Ste14